MVPCTYYPFPCFAAFERSKEGVLVRNLFTTILSVRVLLYYRIVQYTNVTVQTSKGSSKTTSKNSRVSTSLNLAFWVINGDFRVCPLFTFAFFLYNVLRPVECKY